jgi:transcriptional regulator with XRE-family HTH domain
MVSRNVSVTVPMAAQSVRALAVEAWRRAEAMGLVEPGATRLEPSDVARLVSRIQDAGIARGPALHEWPSVSRVLDPETLAGLLNISASSLRRYLSGERETPDDVAARLHHVALIVGDLGGAYNEVGVRRWFERKRSALGGRNPAALLGGNWSPEDQGPRRVRELAASLVSLSAT